MEAHMRGDHSYAYEALDWKKREDDISRRVMSVLSTYEREIPEPVKHQIMDAIRGHCSSIPPQFTNVPPAAPMPQGGYSPVSYPAPYLSWSMYSAYSHSAPTSPVYPVHPVARHPYPSPFPPTPLAHTPSGPPSALSPCPYPTHHHTDSENGNSPIPKQPLGRDEGYDGSCPWADEEVDDKLYQTPSSRQSAFVMDSYTPIKLYNEPRGPPKGRAARPPFRGSYTESDPKRIDQRMKQIEIGKKTIGYLNYSAKRPKHCRNPSDPSTPRCDQLCSKRSFDAQVRTWRRALHRYDNEDGRSHGTNESVSEHADMQYSDPVPPPLTDDSESDGHSERSCQSQPTPSREGHDL